MSAQLAPAQRAAICVGELAPYLVTGHGPPLFELEQRAACLEDRLLGGADRDLERGRDLLVRETAELAHHECGPRALREL